MYRWYHRRRQNREYTGMEGGMLQVWGNGTQAGITGTQNPIHKVWGGKAQAHRQEKVIQ